MKVTIASLFISSFSILLSFFADYNGNAFSVTMAVLTGVLFWLGLIAGYILLALINSHRKKFESNSKVSVSKKSKSKRKPAFITFFSNKYALVADFALILFFILTLVFMFIPVLNQSIALISIAFFLFSLHMHGIFNGINFEYIISINLKESRK
jgi:hypothetical protein